MSRNRPESRFILPGFSSYYGGKSGSGTYQTIINHIRPHDFYIEPFAGMASVFRYKKPCRLTILADVDAAICQALTQGIRNDDRYFLSHSKPNEQAHFCGPDKEDIVVMKTDFSHTLNTVLPNYWDKFVLSRRKTVLYLDPPYPLDSRKDARPKYRFELSDSQHQSLLTYAKWQQCDVLISTYPNLLYERELKDWKLVEFESQTRRGKATEWLFMNYPEIDQLHDYSYLGTDYREREKFTRITRRWRRKLERLPPLLQQKLLDDLIRN